MEYTANNSSCSSCNTSNTSSKASRQWITIGNFNDFAQAICCLKACTCSFKNVLSQYRSMPISPMAYILCCLAAHWLFRIVHPPSPALTEQGCKPSIGKQLPGNDAVRLKTSGTDAASTFGKNKRPMLLSLQRRISATRFAGSVS